MSTQAQLEAYAAVNLGNQQAEALDAIRALSGCTYDEVEACTGMLRVSVRRAVNTLRNMGLVMDSGKMRMGDSGCNQTVWVPGDDRDVVLANRLRSCKKIAAELGYTLVPIEADDEQA